MPHNRAFNDALRGMAMFWLTCLLGLSIAVGTAQPTHAENTPQVSSSGR